MADGSHVLSILSRSVPRCAGKLRIVSVSFALTDHLLICVVMACELSVKSKQEMQLLPDVVVTEQQSLVVIKKLLAIAVSTITYLRGLFPEKAYGIKYVEEQKVMILREERSCPGARQIVQWIYGCFDALQKKYLRMVLLSIYSDPRNSQKITECYKFKIYYTERGTQMNFQSIAGEGSEMALGNTRKASILLVRKLYTLMQNLGPLPDSVSINMQLSYYDEVTPQAYQPPGFKEGDSVNAVFEKEPINLTMGEVVTPFHTLKLDVSTERERVEQVDGDELSNRDHLALKNEEEEQMPEDAVHNDMECVENSDVTYRKKTEVRAEILDPPKSQKAAGPDDVVKRTRSGRIIRSSAKKTETDPLNGSNKTPANGRNMMSQLEFPPSQDAQPAFPKKRKFSETKDCF